MATLAVTSPPAAAVIGTPNLEFCSSSILHSRLNSFLQHQQGRSSLRSRASLIVYPYSQDSIRNYGQNNLSSELNRRRSLLALGLLPFRPVANLSSWGTSSAAEKEIVRVKKILRAGRKGLSGAKTAAVLRRVSHGYEGITGSVVLKLGGLENQSRNQSLKVLSKIKAAPFAIRGVKTPIPRTNQVAKSIICRGVTAAAVAEIVTLKPFLDKLMLFGTVMFYYITGVSALPPFSAVVPGGNRVSSEGPRVSTRTQKSVKKKKEQQQQKTRGHVLNGDTWLALDSKFSKTLSHQDCELEEQLLPNPLLSLQAFSRSSRQHLLYTTLQQLRKEVMNIAETDKELSLLQWRDLSLRVLSQTLLPICQNWISQDFTAMNQTSSGTTDFQVPGLASTEERVENISLTQSQALDRITEFLKETQSIQAYLIRGGKAELYADLIFFLRFGSIRIEGCCDYRSFSRYAEKALEDMVVVIAEVVATLFLDSCSSVATLSPQSETWQAFLRPSILSTRSLERFRNEVALNGWLNQNFSSVVAMFEDRFELWTFQRQSTPCAAEKKVRSKRQPEKGEVKEVESPELVLTRVQLPARRGDELKALTGWRYYYSLYLEFSDVVGPILGMLLTRFGEAVSFLLVRLIGRSLGLVFQGIRQSVRWSPSK
ncbi:hypothetical protein R1flu_002422 [Riccia fluitans]|uniref:Uncharacterized protein n=1 Tax=Riccia fluitans TaxID=41844 RepID=A0ABD1Y9E9_9MARC